MSSLSERLEHLELDGNQIVNVLAIIEEQRESATASLRAERQWRPIETAPKDGREVLLAVAKRAGIPDKMLVGHYMPGGHCIEDHPAIDEGWYFWNGHMFDRASKPTHWQPLPAPPALTEKQA